MQGAHVYKGSHVGRAQRLQSKIAGGLITIKRLEELLGKREPIEEAKVAPRPVGRTSNGDRLKMENEA